MLYFPGKLVNYDYMHMQDHKNIQGIYWYV
jgi:hypothetical protein